MSRDPLARIVFPLQVKRGWPPVSAERLWAQELGDLHYRIENVPWFVRDLAVDDVVIAEPRDNYTHPVYRETVEKSAHLTIRLACFPNGPLQGELQPVLDDVRAPRRVCGRVGAVRDRRSGCAARSTVPRGLPARAGWGRERQLGLGGGPHHHRVGRGQKRPAPPALPQTLNHGWGADAAFFSRRKQLLVGDAKQPLMRRSRTGAGASIQGFPRPSPKLVTLGQVPQLTPRSSGRSGVRTRTP
jgi:hypothetical protein